MAGCPVWQLPCRDLPYQPALCLLVASPWRHSPAGWAWLGVKPDGSLVVTSTANQDNPLQAVVDEKERHTPILGLDVWE